MTKPGFQDVLPLSPLQEGLLFHTVYHERSLDIYTARLRLDLEGELDTAAMRASVAALLRRHPNLRAAFRYERLSRPVQLIPREVPLPWQEFDLRDLRGHDAGQVEVNGRDSQPRGCRAQCRRTVSAMASRRCMSRISTSRCLIDTNPSRSKRRSSRLTVSGAWRR